ncbi:MAG: hypothetical protein WDO06_03715 [Actinomycetota bacterium]
MEEIVKKIIALALTGIALSVLATAPASAKCVHAKAAPVKPGTVTIQSLSVIPGLNGCC